MAVAYTRARIEVSLPHATNSKTDKTRRHQDTSNYSKLQEKAGKVQTKANTANTPGPFLYDDVGVASLITGCGCGFVRMRIKTIQTSNKNFILKYFRCRDGKRTETRIGMEGICITHSCIPPL